MFVHVRRQANEFEFAEASLSALEMVRVLTPGYECTLTVPKLILRLYLESPTTQAAPMHGNINQHPPQAGRDQNHGMLPQ
jgi:hypothetical protein